MTNSLYNRSIPCPETGLSSRFRNRFHDTAAERRYTKRLELAKQLKKVSGTRYSIEFLTRKYNTMESMKAKLNWVSGCVASV